MIWSDERLPELHQEVLASLPAQEHSALTKDFHLVEAALDTDHVIASLDDRTARKLRRLAPHLPPIAALAWLHPVKESPACLAWLADGSQEGLLGFLLLNPP